MKLIVPTRAAAALLFAVLSVTLLGIVAASPARPAPAAGSWNGYPYLHGVVCPVGDGTSPLVSWDLGNGLSPGYLVQPITAGPDGPRALPPLPSVGAQATSPVFPGEYGFTDQNQIAGFAALISRYAAADDATTAAVAAAVLHAGSAYAGCVDTALAQSLADDAADYAGPYTVTLTGPTTKPAPGQSAQVRALVRSATGTPVPSATVTVTADQPVLGGAKRSTLQTGPDGTAGVTVDVPADTTANSVDLTVSAPIATSLLAVTAATVPGSPAAVPAVAASGVVDASGTATVTIDRTPHPQATLSLSSTGVNVGTRITPKLVVDGLVGHAAHVAVAIVGPLPLTRGSLCATRNRGDFARSGTAYTAQGEVGSGGVGAVTRNASPFTPTRAGCYWATATVTTTDATPAASTTAALPGPLTVLDASVRATLAHAVVGAKGSGTVAVTASGLQGAPATIQATVSGPVDPSPTTGCAKVSFGSGSDAVPSAGLTAAGARGTRGAEGGGTATVPTSGVGCYRIGGQVTVTGAGGSAVSVPLSFAGGNTLLALDPTVTIDPLRLYGTVHSPVATTVSMGRTYGQPAHVRLGLRRYDASPFGCATAVATGGAASRLPVVALGSSTALTGDYAPITVSSSAVTQSGCYLPEAVLTIDANTAVTATAAVTDSVNAINVGVDPDSGVVSTATGGKYTGSSFPVWTVIVLVLLLAGVTGGVVQFAYANRVAADASRPSPGGPLLVGTTDDARIDDRSEDEPPAD